MVVLFFGSDPVIVLAHRLTGDQASGAKAAGVTNRTPMSVAAISSSVGVSRMSEP